MSAEITRRERAHTRTALFALVFVIAFVVLRRPRDPALPLETIVDGPAPALAPHTLVFLHGRGVDLAREKAIVERLRHSGLHARVPVVLLEGPYPSGLGQGWGDTAEEQASSRARVRSRLDALGASRVIVAGFSQGAGVALDLAVEDARIDRVASFSPCLSVLRGELPKREGLDVLLVHGAHDWRCPVEESRSLARVLEAAHRPVRYLELDAGHAIPAEALRALVELASR